MTPFIHLEGVAAALPLANVDTDAILAGRFLKTITRSGLGKVLFASARANSDFVLNRSPWSEARILIALDNFGCGSSREHAVWALQDFGITCVIAPSIADIFRNNCLKNGVLPIVLQPDQIADLMQLAANSETAHMSVDLPSQTITAGGSAFAFDIDDDSKHNLLNGTDEISRTLQDEQAIAAFEARAAAARPYVAIPVSSFRRMSALPAASEASRATGE